MIDLEKYNALFCLSKTTLTESLLFINFLSLVEYITVETISFLEAFKSSIIFMTAFSEKLYSSPCILIMISFY